MLTHYGKEHTMHTESLTIMQWLFDRHILPRHREQKTVIDVGSEDHNGSYSKLCRDFLDYKGCDISNGSNVDYVVDPQASEWSSVCGTYDVVISGQCLEHTLRPWEWIKQVVSLCKPDSWLFLIAPYSWPIHRYPVDCWRILPDGMHELLTYAGMIPITVGHLPHSAGTNGDCFGVARPSGTTIAKPMQFDRSTTEQAISLHYSTSITLLE